MEEQKKDKKEIREEVKSVLKEEKKMVRETIDKVKCVVVFGLKEEKIVNRNEREAKEKERIDKILAAAIEEEDHSRLAIEEFFRIGKFEENKYRPLKIKFATQAMAEEVVSGSWRLAGKEDLKEVWINRDLDEGERQKVKELVIDAKQKNAARTEEEKQKFYWKVKDFQVRKQFFRR